ncbi:MbtH family protein [Streptomyces olivoreticuli]
MTNPFENPDGTYLVLVNEHNQHSLWPSHLAPPMGWTVTRGAAGYQTCLDHIEANWTDLSPKSPVGQ